MFKKTTNLLSKKELAKALKSLDEWKTNPKSSLLHKTFTFSSHVEALVFIARITVNAEVQKHHPDVNFTFCKVKVILTTHELKALTTKDIKLAKAIEKTWVDNYHK